MIKFSSIYIGHIDYTTSESLDMLSAQVNNK